MVQLRGGGLECACTFASPCSLQRITFSISRLRDGEGNHIESLWSIELERRGCGESKTRVGHGHRPSHKGGRCPGGVTGVTGLVSTRYQGELLGLWGSGTLKIVIYVRNHP